VLAQPGGRAAASVEERPKQDEAHRDTGRGSDVPSAALGSAVLAVVFKLKNGWTALLFKASSRLLPVSCLF
jgi:hypothetical protein